MQHEYIARAANPGFSGERRAGIRLPTHSPGKSRSDKASDFADLFNRSY
jgi:hypothetical protein